MLPNCIFICTKIGISKALNLGWATNMVNISVVDDLSECIKGSLLVGPRSLTPTTNKTNGDSDECAEWEKYWRAAFDEFWREYPRKVGKSAALKAWQKIGKRKPDYTLFEKILTALAAQCANNFAGRETQHIPHAATWINGERWNDDIEKPATPSGSKPEGRDIVGRLTGSDWADGFLNPPDVDALGHEVRH